MASTNTVPTTAQTSGAQHGAGLGKKIKGSVDVIHGAGEVLRGNAESAADAFGDAITGKSRPVAETQPATDNVAQKGARGSARSGYVLTVRAARRAEPR